MSDQSRLFLAAVLMMGVLLVSWFISGKTTTQQVQPSPEVMEAETEEEPAGEVTRDTEEDAEGISGAGITEENFTEREITVVILGTDEEPMVTASISTLGGAVTDWRLERYEDYPDAGTGQMVELSEEPWLITRNSDSAPMMFEYSGPDTILVAEEPVSLVLTSGGSASKTFTFTGDQYHFTVENIGSDANTSISAGAIPVTEMNASERGYFKAYWHTNDTDDSSSEKIEALEPVGNVSWIATSSKYFTIILIPGSGERADGYIAPGEGGSAAVSIDDPIVTVYAGPKAYHLLSGLEGGQADMIDFGWPVISWIGKLIFHFMTSVLSFAGNWGVRIIILAFVLKIVLSPLTTKSYVSMQKMQKIQPAMQEIQKKYAKDPKQQQAEMQKLYRESGVNPLGGCLPLLLQMPVFFAMYRVLANMVELRGAGFILWINDLSRPEILIPFGTKMLGLEGIGLMAVLLGLMIFLQQKLTGTSTTGAAGQQQKMMMYVMPFMMAFLFMRFASGLTLYWLVFNILTFIHQEYIKKNLAREANAEGK